MNDDMLEGLNFRARNVFSLAEKEARERNHSHIGTEHILLGLIRNGESIATKALESLGISLETVRQQVEGTIGQGRQAPSPQIPLTAQASRVLDHSRREARQRNSASGRQAGYVGTEHILLGLLREGNGVAARVLVPMGANLGRISQQVTELREGRVTAWGGQPPLPPVHPVHRPGPARPAVLVLEEYGQNFTRQAAAGGLDPVVGREPEIQQVIHVLCQPVRHLPVLVGGTAASRSSVVRGVAQRIAAGEVPEAIRSKHLYVLDPGAPGAGSHARDDDLRNRIQELTAQFGLAYGQTLSGGPPGQEAAIGIHYPENGGAQAQPSEADRTPQRGNPDISALQLLLAVLQESRARNDIILFVDDLVKAAESTTQASSAMSVMAPMLASGQLRIIGGVTAEEYMKSWTEAGALTAYIQPVQVSDPAISYSIGMLKTVLRSAAQTKVLEDY
jgi:ATP-dependent Clp protease ATP-binding subunit ClpA